MIYQYRMALQHTPEHPLYADSAYRLYAWLLEQIPEDRAQWIHEAGFLFVSQHLCCLPQEKISLWTVNLLSEDVHEILQPVLNGAAQVTIENRAFPIVERTVRSISPEELIRAGREDHEQRASFVFRTPTAFKQSGRYTIFPQERLILQSLVLRWTEVFPEYPLNDEDAFEAVLAGLHIVDYQLRTSRYPIKGIRIPGFTGKCVLEAKLAQPLLELWNTLVSFAEFSGIGIKTGLGMGGVLAERNKNADAVMTKKAVS